MFNSLEMRNIKRLVQRVRQSISVSLIHASFNTYGSLHCDLCLFNIIIIFLGGLRVEVIKGVGRLHNSPIIHSSRVRIPPSQPFHCDNRPCYSGVSHCRCVMNVLFFCGYYLA